MMRFLRAFIQALRLTLRGEDITPAHYRPLQAWIAEGLRLLTALEAARGECDLEALTLKLDGRQTSLARSIAMIRHNLVNEYPRLMRLDDPFSMMVVQSSNFNDQYRLGEFLAAELSVSADLRRALAALNEHLQGLPQIEPPPDAM